MSMILTIVANPEKLQGRLMRFCMTIRRRLAISVTQICILMAFRKYLVHKIFLHFCHIYDTAIGQFLKLGIIYVGSVNGNYIPIIIIRGL